MRTTRGAFAALIVVAMVGVAHIPAASAVRASDTSDALSVQLAPSNPTTGDFMLGFEPGTDVATAHDTAMRAGLVPVRWNQAISTLLVRPAHAQDGSALPQHALDTLEVSAALRYVHADVIFEGSSAPDDPEYVASQQWAVDTIDAPSAWDTTTGSDTVIVGVLDTGLDMGHPDIDGTWVAGYDIVNDDADPSDDHGHGTHISGIIGAHTNNTTGVASIGHETMLMPVKVLDSSNIGSAADIADGITWAADHGAHILNLSFSSTSDVPAVKDAIDYADAAGLLLIAAVGNNNSTQPRYPAAYDNVVGVGATDRFDRHFMLSNRGDFVAVSAPGVSIQSTEWRDSGNSYSSRTGTSTAAAHVSAVAALVLAIDDTQTSDDVRTILENTGVDLGDPGYDHKFGHGRLDAAAAVDEVEAPPPPPPPTSTPQPSPTSQPSPTPTVEASGPTLTNIRARRIRSSSARIQWDCSEPCTAQVEYGTTSALGTLSSKNSSLSTRPKRNLSGLSSDTTYYYQVLSENDTGGLSVGPIKTFTTKD